MLAVRNLLMPPQAIQGLVLLSKTIDTPCAIHSSMAAQDRGSYQPDSDPCPALQENQDKFLLQLNREDGWSVMGVFDGHGNWGGRVASAVRDSIVTAMKCVDGRKMNGSDPEMVGSASLCLSDHALHVQSPPAARLCCAQGDAFC